MKSNKSIPRSFFFDQIIFFCIFKNGRKSIFELEKNLKLPEMQFHEKKFALFDFKSFFAWTFFKFFWPAVFQQQCLVCNVFFLFVKKNFFFGKTFFYENNFLICIFFAVSPFPLCLLPATNKKFRKIAAGIKEKFFVRAFIKNTFTLTENVPN